jgi:hypothetical protein
MILRWNERRRRVGRATLAPGRRVHRTAAVRRSGVVFRDELLDLPAQLADALLRELAARRRLFGPRASDSTSALASARAKYMRSLNAELLQVSAAVQRFASSPRVPASKSSQNDSSESQHAASA